jgi:uncharacterized protein (DUF2062 family)
MAKKLVQRLMQRLKMIPDKENIAQNKSLKFLGDKLHQPHLWHINRRSVARAFAVGGFAMYTPPLPWQMIIAAVLAIYFEANLPISVALVWITNPLTWIPLYYVAYALGAFLLGREGYSFDDFKSVFMSLGNAWENLGAPFLLGCFAMMILCAIAGYFGIQAFWRYHVLSAWEKRKQRRRERVRRAFGTLSGEEPAYEAPSGNPQAFLFVLLENAWKTKGAPFLADCIEITGLCAGAGWGGLQTFWNHATDAWERYKMEKQQIRQHAAESVSGETAPTPEAQPATLLAALEAAWITVGKPLLLDGFKMLQIFASAGDAGIRSFWRNVSQAWEQRKTEQREAKTDNPQSLGAEADGPQRQAQE